jgi:hypothetical protein
MHHVSVAILKRAKLELKTYELLEVEYEEAGKQTEGFKVFAVYIHKPLYDFDQRLDDIKKLEEELGSDAIVKARSRLKSLFGEYDLDAIKTLIRLDNQYGDDVVEEALDIVEGKGTSNPKRSIRYLIGTIEGIGSKEKNGKQ